jgi:hypothetical protein
MHSNEIHRDKQATEAAPPCAPGWVLRQDGFTVPRRETSIDDLMTSPWIGLHFRHELLLHYKHEEL